MDFKAGPKTLEEVFSIKKRLIIPRFQREYVWNDERLDALWNDLLDNIELKDNKIIPTEYFLGSLVLIDSEDTIERQVIDGQQRLTVFTVFFSALYEIFKSINESELADIIYSYVITKDNNGKLITLLETESPKPFFQCRIQAKDKDTNQQPNTKEEQRLLDTYTFFLENLSKENLEKVFSSRFDIPFNYLDTLKCIRDQILKCKLVYVTVTSINDAYMIFEVLNGKGEPLNSIDLVKNRLFSILKTTEPIDKAKIQWDIIKTNIENTEELSKFYRYFWLSRYHFIREKKLYEDFSNRIKKNKTTYKAFLKELSDSSINYHKIINPSKTDWNTTEKSSIYYNLQAFSIFNVTQVRTMILILLDLYSKKRITLKLMKYCLDFLEAFHFVFSAICSSRPSGLESRYSKYSILLYEQTEKSKMQGIIKAFITEMRKSIPKYEIFLENFKKLYFIDEKDKDKKKIQYIFSKIERYKMSTNKLDIAYISLEHINSQSTKENCVGYVGNLLPLSSELNSACKSKTFTQKMELYKKSQFITVKEFCDTYEDKSEWTEVDINQRTEELAKLMYYKICNFGN